MSFKSVLIGTVALAIGAAAGLAYERLQGAGGSGSGSGSDEPKIAYWVAPMDPNYRRDAPGKSPMGMDLIPVYEGEESQAATDDADVVRVSPATINNIGIRSGVAERQPFGSDIRTIGYVALDEDATSHVHVRAEGWIEDLRLRSLGAETQKGDVLFAFFSPELAAASWEYVRELRRGDGPMVRRARTKLSALGVADQQIDEIRRAGEPADLVKVYAPRDGVLVQLTVGEGMYISPDRTVMSISDLSSVWVIADVIESQLAAVTPGMEAEVRVVDTPGKVWTGTVDYIYPELDPVARTGRVRLRFDNPDLALRPNMFAEITLKERAQKDILTVPTEAVIRVQGQDRVIMDLGEGRFQPRVIETGRQWNGLTEVTGGLAEGDAIVLSGQFLIDSEASLTAGFARMEDPADAPSQAPDIIAETKAVVNSVTPSEGKINVTHEPIPTLGWPAMTMDFGLYEGLDSTTLPKPGDHVALSIGKGEDGSFLAVSMAPLTGAPEIIAETKAVVNSVTPSEGKINVTHEPIPVLGWPAMTMDFGLYEGVDPATLPKPGDHVFLSIGKGADGSFLAVEMAPIPAEVTQ